MNTYVGYRIVIAYVFLILPDSFAGKFGSDGRYIGRKGIIWAISVDMSANMAYALKHE